LCVIGSVDSFSAAPASLGHDRITVHASLSQEFGAVRTNVSIAELSSIVAMDWN
jgi:hypothetical protein